MTWQQPQLTNLRRVLAELYPRDADQRRVVADAKLPASTIAFDAAAANSWSGILREAALRGVVDAILEVAVAEYPDNELLQRARDATPPVLLSGPEVPWHGPSSTRAVLEKIISARSTLAPVSYLELGLRRARSVARVRRSDGSSGSGFLTAGNLLITNHHVLPTTAAADGAVAQFNYQETIEGAVGAVDQRPLRPSEFFATSATDDWTAVLVAGNPATTWGEIDLGPTSVHKDALVNIVQHPGGGYKQLSIAPSVVVYVGAGRLQYLTDTLPGSSGSPVFDERWNLVGLHHSGGWLTEPGGDAKQVFYRNEGITIDVVIAGLAAAKQAQ